MSNTKLSENATKNRPKPVPCPYKTGRTLGNGTYSVVKEVIHTTTGKHYAAKIISKKLMLGREHMVRNEIAVLKRISQGHKNILTLVDYFETAHNLYLITDLACGGELFDRICSKGQYYESDAANLIHTITDAVLYLHQHGIVHRDLKAENLLFRTNKDDDDVLIADFGLSRIIEEEKLRMLTTTCGTPGYMAPEIFNKSGYGKPVDVWAIGVLAYFLLCGYAPFDRTTNEEELQDILKGNYDFEPEEDWEDVSENAKDFIKKCLTVDSTKRMTAKEALSHPWLASLNINHGEEETDLLPTVSNNIQIRRLSISSPIIDSNKTMIDDVPPPLSALDGAYSISPEASKTYSYSYSNNNSSSNAKTAIDSTNATVGLWSNKKVSTEKPPVTPLWSSTNKELG